MERCDVLYRFSDTQTARFDDVRPDMDIPVVAGKVQPGKGGIVVFTSRDLCRAPSSIFALKRAEPLPNGLTILEDTDSHCLIAPSREMGFLDYKGALAQLNSQVEAVPGSLEPAFALASYSKSNSRALRFVYEALVVVWRERVVVDGWDENDYAYVALLARDLDSGQLTLDELRWSPEVPEWTRRGAFTAQAVRAYIAWAEEQAVGDEDLEMYIGNDKPYYQEILRLNPRTYSDNPYARREM